MYAPVYVCSAVYSLCMDQCMYVRRCTPYVWTSVCIFGGVLPMYGPVSVCMFGGVLTMYGPVYVYLAVYSLCMDQCMYIWRCTPHFNHLFLQDLDSFYSFF